MNKSIKIKHILLFLFIASFILFAYNNYTSKSYLKKQNKTLQKEIDSVIELNTRLYYDIDINNAKIQAQNDLIQKSNRQYQRVIYSLSQLKKSYNDEKNNPVYTTTDERVDFIRSRIGK